MAEGDSIFDAVDSAHEAAAIALARAQIDAGLGVPHEKVREWLLSWGTENELPCPVPPTR